MELNCGVFRLCAFADEAAADRAGQIRALRDNRMSLLEIRNVDGVSIADLPEETARRFREELDEAGIRVGRSARRREKVIFTRILGRRSVGLSACCAWRRYLMLPASACSAFYGTGGEEWYFPEVCRRVETFVRMATDAGVIPCHENEKGIWGRYRAPVPGAA